QALEFRSQHQVRKVDVPLVRRHVRTFRHVAHVAQVAVVDDLPVRLARYRIDLARVGLVDRVEQRRERVAQAEAAPAAMADIEDPLHLGIERLVVGELRRAPCERIAHRRVQAAFADALAACSWIVLVGGRLDLAHRRRGSFRAGIDPGPRDSRRTMRESARGGTASRAVAAATARGDEDRASPGPGAPIAPTQASSASRAFWKRFACERSAFASVSNQSAISSKPSSRAVFAMPGYISVYSYVSPAIAAFRLLAVEPIGRPVAGSPTASRYSRWPCACPVSPSAVERNTAATSL